MIIQCDKCNTKFRLDDSRVLGGSVKVRCTKCQNVFIVNAPPSVEDASVEEVYGTPLSPKDGHNADARNKKTEVSAAREGDKKDAADARGNLKFDFEKPGEKKPQTQAEGMEDSPPAASAPDNKADDGQGSAPILSFGDIDLSFITEKPNAEPKDSTAEGGAAATASSLTEEPVGALREFSAEAPKTEKAAQQRDKPDNMFSAVKQEPSKEERPIIDGLDFNFNDLVPQSKGIPPHDKDDEWKIFDDSAEAALKDAPLQSARKAKEASKPSAPFFLTMNDKDNLQEPFKAASSEGLPGEDRFSEIPSDVFPKDATKDTSGTKEARSGMRGFAIVLAALIVIGALVYFTGALSLLKGATGKTAPVKKTLEIDTIHGFYAENKNFGKLFVIEARLKNISDEPAVIKGIKGVIYNSSGDRIAERMVSPGRTVSNDDIKNLPKEDLLKPLRDASGGAIPPKGTVPVTVLFTEIPPGMAEYGIDIIR